jgi:hypothetical protein
LRFSLQAVSPEIFGYTLVYFVVWNADGDGGGGGDDVQVAPMPNNILMKVYKILEVKVSAFYTSALGTRHR